MQPYLPERSAAAVAWAMAASELAVSINAARVRQPALPAAVTRIETGCPIAQARCQAKEGACPCPGSEPWPGYMSGHAGPLRGIESLRWAVSSNRRQPRRGGATDTSSSGHSATFGHIARQARSVVHPRQAGSKVTICMVKSAELSPRRRGISMKLLPSIVCAVAVLAGCVSTPTPTEPGTGRGTSYVPMVAMEGVDKARYDSDVADCRTAANRITARNEDNDGGWAALGI